MEEKHNVFLDFFTSIFITILVWEGNLRLDDWLNKKLPWVGNAGKRILIELLASMVYSAVVIYCSMLFFNQFVCPLLVASKEAFMSTAIIIG